MTSSFPIGWRQVAACAMLTAAVGMIASAYGVIAVPLGREFQPSRMVLMLAMTIMSAATAVLSPIFGSLMDRVSMRLLMGCGAASVVVGFLALSFAQSMVHVLVVYGVFMSAATLLIGPMAATVLLSRWFERRRGTAISLGIAGVAVGAMIYPVVAQLLFDAVPWREALRWLALILALTLFPSVAVIVDRPSDRGLHPDGEPSGHTSAERAAAAGAPLSSRAILSDPTFWLAAMIFAVVLSGMKGMVTNLAPLAVDEGVDATQAAVLVSITAACGLLAKFAFAFVADKVSLRAVLLAALIGFAVGMACLIRADAGYGMIAAGVVVAGFFGALISPLQSVLVPRIFGSAVVGRASGLLNMVVLLALLASPPVFGLIFDLTGDYDVIFMIFVALAVAAMVLATRIRLQPRDVPLERRTDDDGIVTAHPVKSAT